MWLLLLHANYKTDYFSTHNVQISDYDSIAGVSCVRPALRGPPPPPPRLISTRSCAAMRAAEWWATSGERERGFRSGCVVWQGLFSLCRRRANEVHLGDLTPIL